MNIVIFKLRRLHHFSSDLHAACSATENDLLCEQMAHRGKKAHSGRNFSQRLFLSTFYLYKQFDLIEKQLSCT